MVTLRDKTISYITQNFSNYQRLKRKTNLNQKQNHFKDESDLHQDKDRRMIWEICTYIKLISKMNKIYT